MTKEEGLCVGLLPSAAFSTRGERAPQGPWAGLGNKFDGHSWDGMGAGVGGELLGCTGQI